MPNMTSDAPMIEARDIRKAFGANQVLRGVSLQLRQGEVVAVIGPSGSGKSTFLRCLNHLETIDSGHIAIEGETLVMALDRKGFAVASGSACSSDSSEPSSVLLAMGVEADLAKGAVRVSLGPQNRAEQVDAFQATLEQELARLRQLTAIAV